MREPKEVVNVMIPISVMDKVCQIAEKERKTISGFIREIVIKEMNKYEWGE